MLKVELENYRIVRTPFGDWVVVDLARQRVYVFGKLEPEIERDIKRALLDERERRLTLGGEQKMADRR